MFFIYKNIERETTLFCANSFPFPRCLQTLKHMYEDLRELDGSSCASEPEFRAYEVLMNLNDGDVLRAILTLEDWVREAPEVRAALDAFMALSSRNYVRFFKLVSFSGLFSWGGNAVFEAPFSKLLEASLQAIL